MKKPVEVKHTTYEFYCDVCGKRVNELKVCLMCKKEICEKCLVYTDSEYLSDGSFHGDYPDRYCKSCWNAGQPFISEIKQIRQDAENCEDVQWELWKGAVNGNR